MKYKIILHTTTNCNYDCSYCNVVKDKRNISKEDLGDIIDFVNRNKGNIENLKFFGGEPLLVFDNIKYLIDNTYQILGSNYEIVTNTSILDEEIGFYFKEFFSKIFFSVDTENSFDYSKVSDFIGKYILKEKLYFNIIFQPGEEKESFEIFKKLYNLGFYNFNILPVYYTKVWQKEDLLNFSIIMREILDFKKMDNRLKLVGFQENSGEKASLVNDSIFIDVDSKVYYSDIVSTFAGKDFKDKFFLGKIKDISLEKIPLSGVFSPSQEKKATFQNNNVFEKEVKAISKIEEKIYNELKGQRELHKIMDYFSEYLNHPLASSLSRRGG